MFRVVSKRIPRVGIGGPVGSEKTMLIEKVVPLLYDKGYKTGIISNDVVSKEDAVLFTCSLSVQQKNKSTQIHLNLEIPMNWNK